MMRFLKWFQFFHQSIQFTLFFSPLMNLFKLIFTKNQLVPLYFLFKKSICVINKGRKAKNSFFSSIIGPVANNKSLIPHHLFSYKNNMLRGKTTYFYISLSHLCNLQHIILLSVQRIISFLQTALIVDEKIMLKNLAQTGFYM